MIRPEGFISCNCNDKDDFGIVTLHFEGYDNKLDIDLRDYVYYDENASYKCRLNVFYHTMMNLL